MEVNMLSCCGLRELHDLSNYRRSDTALIGTIQTLLDEDNCETLAAIKSLPLGNIIFTQAGSRSRYGFNFAKYLVHNKLGKVQAVPRFKNHNSGNYVNMFIWTPDRDALYDWALERKKKFYLEPLTPQRSWW
jgi:hypothetical protein